jgi:hypothetical protein
VREEGDKEDRNFLKNIKKDGRRDVKRRELRSATVHKADSVASQCKD